MSPMVLFGVAVFMVVLYAIVARTRPSSLENARTLLDQGKAIHAQIEAKKALAAAERKGGAGSVEAVEARVVLAKAQASGHEPESALETLEPLCAEGAPSMDDAHRAMAVDALMGAARVAQTDGQRDVTKACYERAAELATDENAKVLCAEELKRLAKGKSPRWKEIEGQLSARLTEHLQAAVGNEVVKKATLDTSGIGPAVAIDFGREPEGDEGEKLQAAVHAFLSEQGVRTA
ncbi:MAG: hypothetical protein H6704_24625 [Myxococcales bacterium]|nr:hypothetical protein [Myxococcales bacterium]